ncbi:histidine kinase [Actinoplanes awajinensis subsp. mycoplanecinus]|uniref:Sensor-like histidine kinase SenX3 n=1 Tax=Actinoplanes awajinensis subsp. mycoplanecinus TaxID=135947 RepID=A0A124G790_9ACTN|nr:histidine kinase [Actinoplanes awajinensis subsp. mycoplanecinus]
MPFPDLEQDRLAALHEYQLLDEPADDELSAVVRVAAVVADVPHATLNLMDENRQCSLTTVGFEGGDIPRTESMCNLHFLEGGTIQIPDATRHPRYAGHPHVDGRLGAVRFYASTSLVTPAGYVLGTLCVFDFTPKTLTDRQLARLEDLGAVLVGLFERRRQARLNAAMAAESERNRKFIDTVLETVEVGIAASDETGELTVLNRAARRWGGVELSNELPSRDQSRYRMFRPDGVTPLAEDETPLQRVLRENYLDGAEMILRTASDDYISVLASGRAMFADTGERIGAVVALTDITSDRVYRRRLEQAHTEVALREEQLQAAVVELERSNDELEGFAAAVSHDLVRPLAGAHGYLDLLDEAYGEHLDARAAKWVGGALRAVERMQQLVQALLSYARAGHAPCQPGEVDLNDVVEQVTADLRTLIESGQADVGVQGRLPVITGDHTLIRQLLQNLVDNAIKYRHPDRRPRIRISCSAEPDGWHIVVTDNGMGIPAEHRARIFDMFAQVDPESRKGHGIGLSTCLRIVERHGGTIELDDAPGGGTAVRLRMPLVLPG